MTTSEIRDIAIVGIAAFVIVKFYPELQKTLQSGSGIVSDVGRVTDTASDLIVNVLRAPENIWNMLTPTNRQTPEQQFLANLTPAEENILYQESRESYPNFYIQPIPTGSLVIPPIYTNPDYSLGFINRFF